MVAYFRERPLFKRAHLRLVPPPWLSVYLRELNVPVPAIYGPSADENPLQRSRFEPHNGLSPRLSPTRPESCPCSAVRNERASHAGCVGVSR